MAWTFNASGAASNGNNAASLAPGLPAGWAAGHLHILEFQNFGGTNSRRASLPSGWTSIGGDTGWLNGTTNHAVYYRVAQSGDSAPTLTLTGTGATNDTQVSRIHGFIPDSGQTGILSVTGATSTNASADDVGPITGITPNSGELAILSCGKSNDWNGTAVLSGWTLAAITESTTGSDAGEGLLYILNHGGSATGNLTVTDDGATASAGVGLGILASFKQTNNVTVSAGLAALTAAGFAAIIAVTANVTVLPDVGAASATGYAPVVALAVEPGVGTATATGFAPGVALGVLPGVGAVDTTGFVPTIDVSTSGTTVLPGTGAATAAGFVPVVALNILSGVGAVDAAGLAPIVALNVLPGVGAATVAGFAPVAVLTDNQTVATGVGAGTLAGLVPTVALTNNQTVTAGVGAASVAGFAPVVALSFGVLPGAGVLDVAGFAPVAKVSGIPLSALPSATSANLLDELIIVQNGVTKRVTIGKVLAAV